MKVGFTVGVFDLFHEGHERLLEHCAERCDYLVVGLVTDDLARWQKGHERPAWSFEQRYTTVRKHPGVARVVRFDSLSPEHIERMLRFVDVWFRGENQRNMLPVDWPAIEWVPETPGISTTLLLANGGPV